MRIFGGKAFRAKGRASAKTSKQEQQGGLYGQNGDLPYLAEH